ncbi:DUF3800 domain-containing protein [Variovorax paradoxus]|uniref:DUF3800 domain-containing protein n=1 Tax=Variovorax paradoxus (strain EPS) TaxID=595537 RepID=E6V7F8_VARPE|nr:DUF3800 domain-containing protein [Variovorax paradoxus]ADU34880.1 hypothetical protein Varpa_0660 [Variovorax paradoxus EPS]
MSKSSALNLELNERTARAHMDYFLDESGSSGDLIHTAASLDFGGQPFFTLACVGIPDTSNLHRDMEQLRQQHRLLAGELKASALRSKPELFVDLVELVRERDWPWFVEVVDKRYSICANLVTWQLLPPLYSTEEGPESSFVRNTMADCLFAHAPPNIFSLFLDACRSPSDDSVRRSLQTLQMMPWLTGVSGDIAKAIRHSATQSLEDFEEMQLEDAHAYKRFLPPPDDNKRGLPVWMLPNLGSLTHIYARINQSRKQDLSSVRLIHDEQHHFDAILFIAKRQAEAMAAQANKVYAPHADFRFVESAELVFARSQDHVGLQLADMLAGFVMRYMRDYASGRSVQPSIHRAFEALLEMADPDRSIGMNFVIPTQAHAAMLR